MYKNTEEKICIGYKKGKSGCYLSKIFEVGNSTIYRILKRNGELRRNNSQSYRKHTLDESIFDQINEESAYWIGFLMADGNVHYGLGQAQISLACSYKDINHLRKFKSFLQSGHKIVTYNAKKGKKEYPSCKITIRSNKIADTLFKYGVTPRKTFTAKVCKELEYNRHFWRGVVDGDGSIGTNKKEYNFFQLLGSFELMSQFKKYINFITNRVNVKKSGNIYRVSTTRGPAKLIIQNLYENTSVYLDRKRKIADSIISL